MDYRILGDAIYIRMDRGEDIPSSILEVCQAEGIASATYAGIGGCSAAEIAVFDPEAGSFATERIEAMLEMLSIIGSVFTDDAGELHQHAHAQFSYVKDGEHHVIGGHIKSITVLYTAEIELRPVQGGTIGAMLDAETGTFLWKFE